MVCGPDDDIEDIKEEVMKDMASLTDTLVTVSRGVFVQASTLGALEARARARRGVVRLVFLVADERRKG